MRVRSAAVLLLLLLPLAQAQLQQGDTITVETAEKDVTVSSQAAVTFTATVTRGGTATPLGDLSPGDVEIRITGVPQGWTASAEPNGFPLATGNSRDVTITVTVSPGSDADAADLTITAALSTPDPSGTLQPAGEDATKVAVTRDETLTQDILQNIGPGIWAVLGIASAALIVAIYLLVDARRTSVRLTGLGGEATVRPGATVSLPFHVRISTGGREHVILSANSPDPEWGVDLPTWQLDMEPGGEEELLVAVTAPKKAAVGSRGIVRIVAVPDTHPDKVATLTLTALVES